MKPSRFSSFLHIALICCTLYSSSLSAQSATEHAEPESLPLTGNGSFSAPDSRRNDSLMPGTVTTPPVGNEEGRNRLRSAYDRSSNPAYYDMLDRLERDQKRRNQQRRTTRSTPPATPDSSTHSNVTERSHTAHVKKHTRKYKRSKHSSYRNSKKSKYVKSKYARSRKSYARKSHQNTLKKRILNIKSANL